MSISHRHSDASTIHASLAGNMWGVAWVEVCVRPPVEAAVVQDLASDPPAWIQESHNLTKIRAGR
jgi:hypothetical protein